MKTPIEIAQSFVDWTKKKIRHHSDRKSKNFYFREKEIWWAALGQNIGYEANGKHELFERPVLILKKYSGGMCFVLPCTTKIKTPNPWYQYSLVIDGTPSAVNLSQGRSISTKRLLRKIETADTEVYNNIIEKFSEQFRQKEI
jgi:mRNA interferase MazF